MIDEKQIKEWAEHECNDRGHQHYCIERRELAQALKNEQRRIKQLEEQVDRVMDDCEFHVKEQEKAEAAYREAIEACDREHPELAPLRADRDALAAQIEQWKRGVQLASMEAEKQHARAGALAGELAQIHHDIAGTETSEEIAVILDAHAPGWRER